MKLSKRLSAIKNLIEKSSILADIGCDHAYLSCACVVESICVKAYACDVNEGPLLHAKKTIEECGLTASVIPILTNGLQGVPSDVEVVVISGMGFETIRMILENDSNRLSQFKQIILQSNSDLDLLREWISSHRYKITHEQFVYDVHYYQIIVIEPIFDDFLTSAQIEFGINLYKDPLFNEYFTMQKQKWVQILSQLDTSHPKFDEITQQIQRIDEQLKNEF